jgi:endonuclease-3 related protein
MNSSYDLWLALYELDLLKDSPPFWWPNVGEFEVVVGAILTQQTKWENVQKALANLQAIDLLSLESLSCKPIMIIEEAIRPSGYYRKKTKTLQLLCQAILDDFGDFDTFKEQVTRAWLISQKGVGLESADAILCYACKREVMVVDNYTNKLLKSLNYDFESYDALQEWLVLGIEMHIDKIREYYKEDISLFTIFSRLHGKIVEYSKRSKTDKERFVNILNLN